MPLGNSFILDSIQSTNKFRQNIHSNKCFCRPTQLWTAHYKIANETDQMAENKTETNFQESMGEECNGPRKISRFVDFNYHLRNFNCSHCRNYLAYLSFLLPILLISMKFLHFIHLFIVLVKGSSIVWLDGVIRESAIRHNLMRTLHIYYFIIFESYKK